MDREIFVRRKDNLAHLIKERLAKKDLSEPDRRSFIELLKLLNLYSFENRLEQKGLLSHTIIDSLELDYSFGDQFIRFDNDIK